MSIEEPFHTDNTDLGDLESEQLYLEVIIELDFFFLSSEYFFLYDIIGSEYSTKTSIR